MLYLESEKTDSSWADKKANLLTFANRDSLNAFLDALQSASFYDDFFPLLCNFCHSLIAIGKRKQLEYLLALKSYGQLAEFIIFIKEKPAYQHSQSSFEKLIKVCLLLDELANHTRSAEKFRSTAKSAFFHHSPKHFNHQGIELYHLISSINDKSIIRYLVALDKRSSAARQKNQAPSLIPKAAKREQNNGIIYDVESGLQVIPSSFDQLGDYINRNSKKVLLNGLLTGGLTPLSLLTWPLSLLTLILSATSASSTISRFSKVIRYVINSLPFWKKAKRVPIVVSSLSNEKSINLSCPSTKLHKTLVEKTLIHLLSLFGSAIPINIIKKLPANDLLLQIKMQLQLNRASIRDTFLQVRSYLLDQGHLTVIIDLDSFKQTWQNAFTTLPLNRFININKLADDIAAIRYQAIHQLYLNGKIDKTQIKALSIEEITTLNQFMVSLTVDQVARRYFDLLSENQQVAKQWLKLYGYMFPLNLNPLQKKLAKSRFTLVSLLKAAGWQENVYLDDKQLLTIYLNNKEESTSLLKACFELMLMPADSYDYAFLTSLLDPLKIKQLEENYVSQNLPLFNCIQLFLYETSDFDDFPLAEKTLTALMSSFYQKLSTLTVDQVANAFSMIRFNTFVDLNLSEINRLIVHFYQQTDEQKAEQIVKRVNLTPSFSQHVDPIMHTINAFLLSTGNYRESYLPKKLIDLLPILFQSLVKLRIEGTVSLLKELLNENLDLKPVQALIRLAYNFFRQEMPEESLKFIKLIRLMNEEKEASSALVVTF